jgi:hypothetical protein
MITKMDAVRFAMDYSAVKAAYDAVREGLHERSLAAEKITREKWGLAPGEELSKEADEQGWSSNEEFWVQVGEVETESGAAVEIIREAFVIALFHVWERNANRWCGVDNYNEDGTFALLKALGRDPNKDKLITLKLLANCLNHGKSSKPSGACNQLHVKCPNLFNLANPSEQPSDSNLVISEALLDDLFQAVVQSGPPASSFNESWPLLA